MECAGLKFDSLIAVLNESIESINKQNVAIQKELKVLDIALQKSKIPLEQAVNKLRLYSVKTNGSLSFIYKSSKFKGWKRQLLPQA